MNRLELLNKLTTINTKEILQYKQSHVSNRVRMLIEDIDGKIFEVTLNDSYEALFDERVYFAKQIKNLDNVNVEDVKDLFRQNDVTENSCIATREVGNYNDHFKLWGIEDVKSLIGHESTERACVSNCFVVKDAELIRGGQVLKITYETDNEDDGTETALYTDYMPVNERTEKEATKAVIARTLFGVEKADDIVNHGIGAIIKSEEEFEELPEIQKAYYCRYVKYYISIDCLNSLPTGKAVKAIIERIVNEDSIYNSRFAKENGIHQGHLSEMRNGKRDINRLSLSNVMTYLDAYRK